MDQKDPVKFNFDTPIIQGKFLGNHKHVAVASNKGTVSIHRLSGKNNAVSSSKEVFQNASDIFVHGSLLFALQKY